MRLLRAWKPCIVRRGWRRGLTTRLSVRQIAKGVAAILILACLLSLLQRRKCWSSLRRLLLLLLASGRVGGLAVAVAVSVPIRVLLVLVGIHTAYGTGGGIVVVESAAGTLQCIYSVLNRIHRRSVPTG